MAFKVRTQPKISTITALIIDISGAHLSNLSNRENNLRLWTIAKPIKVSTMANPRLKESIIANPKKILLIEIASNRMAIASGQGTIPPLNPKLRSVLKFTSLSDK